MLQILEHPMQPFQQGHLLSQIPHFLQLPRGQMWVQKHILHCHCHHQGICITCYAWVQRCRGAGGRSWCRFVQCRKKCPWTEVETCVTQPSEDWHVQIEKLTQVLKSKGTRRRFSIRYWLRKNEVWVCACFCFVRHCSRIGVGLFLSVVILKLEAERKMCLQVRTLS